MSQPHENEDQLQEPEIVVQTKQSKFPTRFVLIIVCATIIAVTIITVLSGAEKTETNTKTGTKSNAAKEPRSEEAGTEGDSARNTNEKNDASTGGGQVASTPAGGSGNTDTMDSLDDDSSMKLDEVNDGADLITEAALVVAEEKLRNSHQVLYKMEQEKIAMAINLRMNNLTWSQNRIDNKVHEFEQTIRAYHDQTYMPLQLVRDELKSKMPQTL